MKGNNHKSLNSNLWCLLPDVYTVENESEAEKKVFISYVYGDVASSNIQDSIKDADISTTICSDVNSSMRLDPFIRSIKTRSINQQSYNIFTLNKSDSFARVFAPCESEDPDISTTIYSKANYSINFEQLIGKVKTSSIYQQSYNIVNLNKSDSSAMVVEPCASSLVELDEENYKVFAAHLFDILRSDSFVDGDICNTEIFLLKQFEYLGRKQTLDYIMKFYLPNYGNYHMMCGLIHALSHFEYKEVYPQGPILALALFAHKDIEVKEFSLKAFENWKDKESVIYLEETTLDIEWLDEYRKSVISYIKE